MSDPFLDMRTTGNPWRQWVPKRPETIEQALLVIQALVDCGLTLHADDPEIQNKFDSNPMLERV